MKNMQIITTINKLIDIVDSKEAYKRKVSYAITQNLLTLQKLYEPYNIEREALLEKYKNDEGIIEEKDQRAYDQEMRELLEIDVDFEPHKINIEDMPEDISPQILYKLDFMIEE